MANVRTKTQARKNGSGSAKNSHVAKGITVRDELENLRRMFPVKNGLRLRASGEALKRTARSATLWLLVESNREYALHETVFAKQEKRSADWWQDFMSEKVLRGTGKGTGSPAERSGIVEGSILPGMYLKSRKRWNVRAVIGYNLHDLYSAIYTQVHKTRH